MSSTPSLLSLFANVACRLAGYNLVMFNLDLLEQRRLKDYPTRHGQSPGHAKIYSLTVPRAG